MMKEERARLKRVKKNGTEQLPVLTIITVVRNCENTIEQTILSVIKQGYPNIEYIIIDGKSTDDTLNIIKKYEEYIDRWISEPDKGIYDAMNKGILLASGDWVNFMNAGDEFHGAYTCNRIGEYAISTNSDILYGDVIAKDEFSKLEILVRAKPLAQIWKGMVFSHQSAFIKRQLLLENPFNLDFKIVADFNQIISFYINKVSFYYIPEVISNTTINGLSYSTVQTTIEKIKVVHKNDTFSLSILYFIPNLIIDILRMSLGEKLTKLIRKYKWRYLTKKS